MRFPRLSADGSQVLYLVESEQGDHLSPASLMSKPLAGGPPRLVLRENGISNYQCARAPSQLCIFSKLVGDDHILVSFDLEHGRGREITRIPNGLSHWSLSPVDRGLHSSWTRIEFDFSHRTPVKLTMLA